MALTEFNADMGRTQFLQLMVSQLQYQNPLQPVEQQDFLSQLAQFSVLDGVEEMNARFDDLIKLQSLSQGADIVGRQVEYISTLTGETATGRVTAARLLNGNIMVTVNNEQVNLNALQAVLADTASGS